MTTVSDREFVSVLRTLPEFVLEVLLKNILENLDTPHREWKSIVVAEELERRKHARTTNNTNSTEQ